MEIRTSEDATLSPVADSNGSDNNKMEEQVSPPDTSGPPQQRLEALLPSTATCPQQGSLTRVSGQMEHGSELPGAEEAGHGVEREAEAAGEAHPGSEMMVGAGQILAANQDRMHLGMGRGRMDLAKEASRHSYCLDAADSLAKEGPMPGKRSVDDDAPPRSGLHKVPATALQPDAADISEVGDGAWPLALPPISTGPETDGDDEQIEDDDQSLSSSPFASNPENPEVSSDDLLAPSGDGARAALRGTWPATKLSADDFPAVGMYTSSATALPIPGAVERDPQARQVNQLEGQWEAAANQEQPRAIERVSSVSLGLVGHRAGSSSSLVINFDDDDDDGGCDDEDSKPSGEGTVFLLSFF